jgi:TolA-binding protein
MTAPFRRPTALKFCLAATLFAGHVAAARAPDAPAPLTSTNAAATAAYASAAALHNREAWDLAAEEWQALLAAHPDDPLALRGRHYLAICQEKLGRWPEAAKTLEAVIASRADAETVALARWDLARGSFAAAQAKPGAEAYAGAAKRLAAFLTAHPAHPRAAEAQRLLGESLWQAGKREEAVTAWERFVRDHATAARLPDVLYALGIGQAELGRRDQAAATLARFAKEFPAHPLAADVALWRADVALAAGKPADAEAAVKVLASGTGTRAADALDRLGKARWDRKDWAGAADAFTTLARAHPASPLAARARVAAGRASVEARRPDAARQLFESALAAKDPESLDAAHWLAVLELDAGRPARAVEVVEQALAAAAGRQADAAVLSRLELDRAAGLRGQPEKRAEAAQAYAKIAASRRGSPAGATAAALAAVTLLELDKPAEALAAADAFLGTPAAAQEAEAARDVRAVRAEALLALGKATDAATAYGELAAANPTSPRVAAWKLRQAAALATAKQWAAAHDTLARATSGLKGDQQAEAMLLDATALLELDQPKPAADLLAALDTAHPQWSRRGEARLLRVRALSAAGDAAAALALAERIVADAPGGPQADVAWYRLGQLRQDAGKPDAAIEAYAKSVAAAPRGPRAAWALLAAGWCHETAGRLPEAIRAWTDLVDGHPKSAAVPEALVARGDARRRSSDFEAGLADARRALEAARGTAPAVEPATLSEARLLEGLCLAGLERHGQAAAAFRRLVDERPDAAGVDRALYELGVAQARDGKAADAAATLQSLMKRFPQSRHAADAWLELGEGHWAQKQWDDAARAYAAAVAAAGSQPLVAEQARHKLGWAHAMRGDHAAAAAAFQEQVTAAPSGSFAADGQAMLGESLLALDKPAEAAKPLAAALADPAKLSSPEMRDAAFLRAAEAAARQEQWEESLARARKLETVAPESPRLPEARYAAAWAEQNLGRLDAALAGYRAVADAARTEVAARARLMEGEVLFEQGRHADAIKAFFKVAYGFGERQAPAAFHPWQAQATFEAARCFEVLGKPAQARGLYAELVDRYPDSEHVAASRRRLEAIGPAAAPPGATP